MKNLVVFAALSGFLASGCFSGRSNSPESELATIKIKSIDLDYDSLRLVIKDTDGNTAIDKPQPFGQNEIAATLTPGTYLFDLSYTKNNDIIVSSEYCSDEDRQGNKHELEPKENNVTVVVCDKEGEVVDASVVIDPIYKKAGEAEADLENGKLLYESRGCSAAACHGDPTREDNTLRTDCDTCDSVESLSSKIEKDMPIGNTGSCGAQCALDIATYLDSIGI